MTDREIVNALAEMFGLTETERDNMEKMAEYGNNIRARIMKAKLIRQEDVDGYNKLCAIEFPNHTEKEEEIHHVEYTEEQCGRDK